MACLDDTTTFDFIEGTLDTDAERTVKEHIATCDECRTLVSEMAKSMRPTAGSSTGAAAHEGRLSSGHTVGRYQVLGVLGAGGMGVVYTAHDPELDRRVALKLLRADLEGPEAAVQLQRRLSREAKAMARLSHENVVMVHDAGTFEGRVFVAMELVDGVSLTSWLRSAPRRWEEVLALYVSAGRGLAAAHRAGLVHRDFKPDNVLVGKDGRPRVTDFGLARSVVAPPASSVQLLDASSSKIPIAPRPAGETVAGVVVGTPAYMAPEQLLGRPADERSDQFSFCVALYEGLYGQSPFQAVSFEARAAEVLEGRLPDPPKGSRVPTRLRRALLRGLRPSPSDRYPSMAALLAALEKQTWRVRRRVIVPIAVVAVLLAGLLGYRQAARDRGAICGGAELRLLGVWDNARKRDIERAFTATGAPYAHDSWVSSARFLDEYARNWTKLYTDACEATHVRGEQSPELLDLRIECLDDRLRRVAALTKVFSVADTKVVEKSIGALEELPSLDLCANTAALRSGVRPPADEATVARAAEIRTAIAEVAALERAGKYKSALGIAQTVVADARALQYLPVEAEALYQLGLIQGGLEDEKAVEATLEEAAAVAEAASHHEIAARAWLDLVYFVGYRQAHYEQGKRWARYAGAAIERMGGEDELEGERLEKLGLLLWSEGKNAEALLNLEQARRLLEKKLGPGHIAVAKTLNAISLVEFNFGEYEAARDLQRQALAIDEAAYGALHPTVALVLNNLANSLWRLGLYDEALAALVRSLDIVDQTVGSDHPDAFVALDSIGSVLTSMGRYDEALASLKHARNILEKAGRVERPDYATVLNDIGEVQRARGVYDEAESLHRQALSVLEGLVGAQHLDVAMTHYDLGEVGLAQGRFRDAADEDKKALSVIDTPLAETPDTAKVLTALGEATLGMNDADQARSLLERAQLIRASAAGEPSDLARTEFALARARWALGDRVSARGLAEQARDTYVAARYFKKEAGRVVAWLEGHELSHGSQSQ